MATAIEEITMEIIGLLRHVPESCPVQRARVGHVRHRDAEKSSWCPIEQNSNP